jgi:hypothetical protein
MRRFKHLVSGLVFALVWWVIYRSPLARVLDVFVMAAIAGAIVWITWDLFNWMRRSRVLGPTELSTKPQFPWPVFAVPFAALASTLLFFALGRRSGFLAGRWQGLAVVVGGVVAALWSGMLMSSTEFRASGLVYSGRAILWEEVGGAHVDFDARRGNGTRVDCHVQHRRLAKDSHSSFWGRAA